MVSGIVFPSELIRLMSLDKVNSQLRSQLDYLGQNINSELRKPVFPNVTQWVSSSSSLFLLP